MSHRQLFQNYLAQTSDSPLMIEIMRAKGIYLFSPNKQKYIDLISGIAVSSLGHSHPKVVNAVIKQSKKFMHLMVYGEYIQNPQLRLAKKLLDTIPQSTNNQQLNLDNVYFVNSGSEAVEGALKLAKRYTQRTEIISCINAYHGSTHGALSVGGSEKFKNAYRPLLPDVKHIRFGQMTDIEQITEKTACLIIETVQGESGVRIANLAYWQAIREKCTQTGTLLILDEIQSGFGRTGKFWAFEHYHILPDILLCAKGMGGGMPIGAFIAPQKIMEVFKNNPILGHITTFGGHPVSCAASWATINTILEEDLLSQIPKKEELFRKLLIHPKIKEVRALGLMMAVEFESFEVLKPIIDKGINLGVITDWFLFCDNSMRIAPPLIISEKQIRKACELILQAIE
ncbi:MAG: aspartate aminotransferase family protein [Bacteroidetes bacterium]|nr:MAG: aspartate aminotransferase family protein [Bacteroidota bacterium]